MISESYYNSPIGILKIETESNALISLRRVSGCGKNFNETELTKNIKSQLEEYFSGKRKNFDIKIKFKGTDFQTKVWKELIKIPYGETKPYQEIARAIGHFGAQRAVGSACNHNPIIIVVPCHRVIAKNGTLRGFALGADTKESLLNLEKWFKNSVILPMF